VAKDFGICAPPEYLTTTPPASDVEYIPLLTRNLTNQIYYGDGDPAVIRVESPRGSRGETWYYLTVTSNDAPDAFPILRSRDLRSWEPRGFIFPRSQNPGWAANGENRSDYWAPEIHECGPEFLAYFVARERTTGELCIGVAKSLRPDGPFLPQSDPLLKSDRIDPHVFAKNDGELYLYWKEDSNGIWPQMLSDLVFAEPRLANELFGTPEQQRTATFISTLAPWTVALDPMERFFVYQPLLQVATADFVQFRKRLGSISEGPYSFAARERARDILTRVVTTVYVQKFDPISKTLVGTASKVLENDQRWEAHVVEGMWVTEQR